MAARTVGKLPLQPPPVIDLTFSDDEDNLPYRNPPNQPSHGSLTSQDLSASNHGLILPGTFNFAKPPQTQPSSRPQPNKNRVAEQSSRTIIPAGDRLFPGAEHAAKRRKTTPTPILPPSHNGVPVAGQLERTRGISEGQNQISTHSALHSSQAAPTPTPNQRPSIAPVPTRKVAIAKRLKADKERVSLNAHIQKPRNAPPRTVTPSPEDEDALLEDVMRNQVFTHVKIALNKYNSSISSSDRSAIGAKTAAILVDDSSFVDNFEVNAWKLSERYERDLALRAKSMVDRYASELLNGIGLQPGVLVKEGEREEDLDDIELIPIAGRSQSGSHKDLTTPSTCSDGGEEVFEVAGKPLEPDIQPLRRYSSSPTTSVSYDTNDVMDLDSYDKVQSTRPTLIRHSPRQLRNATHPNPAPVRSSNRPSKIVQKLKQNVKLKKKKLRKVQPSRLAEGDKNSRPYMNFTDRENIRRGCKISDKYPGVFLSRAEQNVLHGSVFHVDFCLEELEFLCKVIQAFKKDTLPLSSDPRSQIIGLMNGRKDFIPRVISIYETIVKLPGKEVGRGLLQQRNTPGIEAFLQDAVKGKIATMPQLARIETAPRRGQAARKPPITSLLRQREIYGLAPVRVRNCQQSFKVEIASHLEDTLVCKVQWTDCCGDISTLSWTGEDSFVCGATAHSDFHNMQYNKPGNFGVGSCSLDTLRAFPQHRIIRPIVGKTENAENALASMRQTQDPWLYTSVVSTSHSKINGFTFSASFDRTVKVWKVSEDGSSMDIRGAWYHEGKVNFVVTSEHHELVATASDVSTNAIRVYNFNEEDITGAPYDTYCGEKALEQALEERKNDTWAYFPATIQWGKAPGVANFLLVGYSPRSVTDHEVDIPEDKKNTGELCLWNVETGARVHISSGRMQNVFEVIWHPSQPCFIAATSPCGTFEPETKTQIRLFAQNEFGTFLQIKALDCPAFDVNELTIMPNSSIQCWVTASCTDGNTYVWDTAQGDRPIHTLGHGESLDNPIHDLPREIADTGVKFASWGKTADRFYTGSSDGKIKAWDIRRPKGHAYVRTVLSVSGGISAGAFSKNYSKLLVGDATGKVHLLEVEDKGGDDSSDDDPRPANRLHRPANPLPPKVIIPHPEPPAPAGFGCEVEQNELTAHEMAQIFLDEGFLIVHPDRAIGAIQGPNYAETLLYRHEAHEENDGTLPLLAEWQGKQRYHIQNQEETLKLATLPTAIVGSDSALHKKNLSLDLDFSKLSLATQAELRREGVDFDFEHDDQSYEYEPLPSFKVFKEQNNKLRKRTHNIVTEAFGPGVGR